MTFSLRLLARSRRLRAMGMLAWLMLVANSLVAAPMGMAGMPYSHSMHATVAAASEPGHHHVVAEASRSCCGDQDDGHGAMTGYTCDCAAMCNTTLPPAAAVVWAPAAIAVRYVMPLPGSAPSRNTAPPLRPPAV